MRVAIIIPARYGSTRFPGKPLAEIAGIPMIERTAMTAVTAAGLLEGTISQCDVIIATDHEAIEAHAHKSVKAVQCIMTSNSCHTGSDRVMQAVNLCKDRYDFIINLQGDAPFTPPELLKSMVERYVGDKTIEVLTPYQQLSWEALDALRVQKQQTPFTGTTVVVDSHERALWFSKQIIPAVRKEDSLRMQGDPSPVCQHIGLYGYTPEVLAWFTSTAPTPYEDLEGLEQLRFIEHNKIIHMLRYDHDEGQLHAGVDTPEDIARVENYLNAHSDPHKN